MPQAERSNRGNRTEQLQIKYRNRRHDGDYQPFRLPHFDGVNQSILQEASTPTPKIKPANKR